MQRRRAVRRPNTNVRAGVEQQLDHITMAFQCRLVEWRPTRRVWGIDVRALVEQQFGDFGVAPAGREAEWSDRSASLSVRIGASVKEVSGLVEVPEASGGQKAPRRSPGQHHLGRLGVTFPSRPLQWRAEACIILIVHFEVSAVVQEEFHQFRLTVDRRHVERRVAFLVQSGDVGAIVEIRLDYCDVAGGHSLVHGGRRNGGSAGVEEGDDVVVPRVGSKVLRGLAVGVGGVRIRPASAA